ncbi:MAG: bifunctional sterol desaturase/short chain dehydrogenase [Coleofasciculaceae cyanobacterium RL_1_1]|nr:bifunctional sterol desaturase/short chain dehydrogenase [Coleofasciculaceae cyanobacterium RL_1_1]
MVWTVWAVTAVWAIGSVLWVELVRDLYHALAHLWEPLYRLHGWHHRVFKKDLTPFNEQIYREAQWYNDLPESGVMLLGLTLFSLSARAIDPTAATWGCGLGLVYTLIYVFGAVVRGLGFPWAHDLTDLTHLPGPFEAPPSRWLVNRTYHWRHHFDNQDAYFCGVLSFLDRWLGTALSLKNKTVAVTGASGTLGRALIEQLHRSGAKVIALTSSDREFVVMIDGEPLDLRTEVWTIGEEAKLTSLLEKVDILVINHGVNVHADRSIAAIEQSYNVNAFSGLRLMETFLQTVRTNRDIARKEVWVNTSEAEVLPAFSPLYELSKRALGDFVTLRRLDAPCVIRKLILGPFKSDLNPVGVMSADRVARRIVRLAKSDARNIIVTIDPLTFVLHPLKEIAVSLYFRWFSKPSTRTLPFVEPEAIDASTLTASDSANSAQTSTKS